jgi:cyclohexanone monooxygenase
MPYLGFPPYVEKCNDVVAKGYEGFVLTPQSDLASDSPQG